MLDQAKMRALPLVSRTVDLTPAVQACCGVCRTCATTNLFAVAGVVVAGTAAGLVRLAQRLKP